MTLTKYRYSITDFPSGKVSAERLHIEIVSTKLIQIALDHIDTIGRDVVVWFRDELDGVQKQALDNIILRHSGEPLPDGTRDEDGNPVVALSARQADGTSLVAVKARFGREVIYATHSFCDPTTWFWDSDRVEGKPLVENNGVWESGDPNWIDLDHGKVMDEDAVKEDQAIFHPPPHGYAIAITVDGVEQTPRAPFATSGGDYVIDYVAGTVTPTDPVAWAGKTVLATYSKATTSGWEMIPTDGRGLIIEAAEIQFSKDIEMNATLVMEVYGLVELFAPQLLIANGGPLPPGTPIPIETTKYKTMDQLIDEAIGAYPVIPSFSNASKRGYTQERYIFQFHYTSARPVFSSLGMFIRIYLEGDRPLGGERATATFYCLSKIDPGIDEAMAILTDKSGG